MTEENALIRSLAKAYKMDGYCRPSYEDVDKMSISPRLKIMKAFLSPANDHCLHIRRTLDQFYYSTLSQARTDERTTDQVVYRFAMKQHQSRLEEDRKREGTRFKENEHGKDIAHMGTASMGDTESSKSQNFKIVKQDAHEENRQRVGDPPWDPPKVMMVNQLWMWVIDGGKLLLHYSENN
jgi:hypothetical protein